MEGGLVSRSRLQQWRSSSRLVWRCIPVFPMDLYHAQDLELTVIDK